MREIRDSAPLISFKLGKEQLALASCIVRFLLKYRSMKDIAKLLGVSSSTVSRYASGKVVLSVERALKAISYAVETLRNINISGDVLTSYDTLCTLSFIAAHHLTLDDISNTDLIVAFPDPSITLAYILSNFTGIPVNIMFIPPLIPKDADNCSHIMLGSSLRYVACSYRFRRKRLRRSNILLVLPLALEYTEEIGEMITDSLKHEYRVLKLIAVRCKERKPLDQSDKRAYAHVICLVER